MTNLSESRKKALVSNKTLLLHNYDLFLERQSRLDASSRRPGGFISQEVHEKSELLLLDDLTIFAISARRIIDLCCLQSAMTNKIRLQPILPVVSGDQLHFTKLGEEIGFYHLINRIIHMSYFRFFTSITSFKFYMRISTDFSEYASSIRNPSDRINGFFVIKETKSPHLFVRLEDVVDCSADVAEKITDTCNAAGVFLEFDMRVL